MTIQVDTLKLATRLEAGGFTTEQARAVASALGDAAQVADLVTNDDLKVTRAAIEASVASLETKLDSSVASLETKLDSRVASLETKLDGSVASLQAKLDSGVASLETKLALLEQRMTIRLGGMLVVLTGVLLAAIRYLH